MSGDISDSNPVKSWCCDYLDGCHTFTERHPIATLFAIAGYFAAAGIATLALMAWIKLSLLHNPLFIVPALFGAGAIFFAIVWVITASVSE